MTDLGDAGAFIAGFSETLERLDVTLEVFDHAKFLPPDVSFPLLANLRIKLYSHSMNAVENDFLASLWAVTPHLQHLSLTPTRTESEFLQSLIPHLP